MQLGENLKRSSGPRVDERRNSSSEDLRIAKDSAHRGVIHHRGIGAIDGR